ncbi:MAG: PBP1A family penicillin-binding protein [Neisseriaceae bacterium]|nr:PBP1A family penicillin-binding protein [Neisseriaceae bacterium]
MLKKIFATLCAFLVASVLVAIGFVAVAVQTAYPKLPNLDAITHYQPKMPLLIYSSDGQLIGTYGEERRSFTAIEDFPDVLKNAVIAAEDKRFYEHWGVDTTGVVRALISNFRAGRTVSGASTITQQVAKNFFLTNERSFERKFNEALMAYKIERSLTKDQILELYFNHIYLGQRAYGFAAAAKAYFNKSVEDLDLAEASMLAGLPKAPSAFNPIVNPKRAKERQLYILGNMLSLGMITQEQHDKAAKQELHYESAKVNVNEYALYVAEMARQKMYERYGEAAYTNGFRVYTTVNSKDQEMATNMLRKRLDAFGVGKFSGAEAFVDIDKIPAEQFDERTQQYVANLHKIGDKVPALVLEVNSGSLKLLIQGERRPVIMQGKAMAFVADAINNSKYGERRVRAGSILRVVKTKDNWQLTQVPEIQGAIVSIDAQNGAIRALVGGYDFYQKEFNRATQALRQPGSSFKPFVYSAALQRGVTATTQFNDEPLSLPGLGPNGTTWEPKNSGGTYRGLMTMHEALVWSKNIVSVRIMMAIGTQYTHNYVQRFGFPAKNQPNGLTMTLGAGSVTPLEMARAYAVFANGGYRVTPYVIDKIYDSNGNLLAKTEPLIAHNTAPQVIDERNAFIMTQMMKDVVKRGTAAKAAAGIKRNDIAGKTGTTNDSKDVWFVGYNPALSTAVYIGYDKPRTISKKATGGTTAAPLWADYMQYALQKLPVEKEVAPANMVARDGRYYYQEYQVTNPLLAIDNRSDEEGEDSDLLGQDDNVVEIQQPQREQPSDPALDSLF